MFNVDLKPVELLLERLCKAFEERNVLLREQNEMARTQLKAALEALQSGDEPAEVPK